jgi:c-di-GMP phosphodiesterase
MSTSLTFNSAYRILLASAFFMARRPILDRDGHLAGNELLFLHPQEFGDRDTEELMSASVIDDVKLHGLIRVIGDGPVYLHVDHAALMSDVFDGIPPDRVVLTLFAPAAPSPALLERIAGLRRQGFRFKLQVTHDAAEVQLFLPLVDTVRIDIAGRSPVELATLCGRFRAHRKTLLAEGVETAERFRECIDAGFDLFQGYFFARPEMVVGKKLSFSQQAITELMVLVGSDADSADIEQRVKTDVTLGLNLLRLVNTPAISSHRIDSLRQALIVLGRNQLQRWLQIMLYTEAGGSLDSIMPLLTLAATRGRLLELLAQKLKPANRSIADTAFTVGIMSLMDTLFGMPMAEILQQLPVTEEVADALLQRSGYFGHLLTVGECAEWRNHDGARLQEAMTQLRLSHNDLYALQLAAYEWSDQVSRSLH